MKRMTLTQGVAFAFATYLLFPVPASAEQGQDRPTDKAIEQIIANVEKTRNAFEAAIDDKVKASIVRAPRGELRLDAYLDDLETTVKNLKSRFDKSNAATSEVETVLRQASIIDGAVKTAGAGMKGATEWTALATELQRLAGAYNTAFPLVATSGSVTRVNDADAAAAAEEMKRHAKRLSDSIEGNAGIAKEARDGAKSHLAALEKQSDVVRSRITAGQPGAADIRNLLDHVAAVEKFMKDNKVMPQTQAYWETARSAVDKLKKAYGIK